MHLQHLANAMGYRFICSGITDKTEGLAMGCLDLAVQQRRASFLLERFNRPG